NKQISQLNTFDYITGITIGSIAAEMATDLEDHLLESILAMVVYTFIAVCISFATNKSMWARKLFAGKPIVLLENNKLYKNRLEKAKLDINEFLGMCRLAGFFDLSQVETAVFEHNGAVSFLPKSNYRAVNPDDLKIPTPKDDVFVNVIIDGKIIEENLKSMGKDGEWLKKEMALSGYHSEKEIFLLSIDRNSHRVCFSINQK
ncbi:MAG: DUF421 domain-containing protein, partial [Oscillospiraceae bacterium]